MKRPKIKITLIDQKGEKGCHRGHKINVFKIEVVKENEDARM